MPPMNGKRMAVAVLVAAGLLSPVPAGAQARHEEPTGIRQALDATVAAGAPGVLARIDDDRGTWIGTSGTADLDTREPVPREARFRVASVTKSMVAAIVLQLVQEGRLSLDEPIGKRLPGRTGSIPGYVTFSFADATGERRMTLSVNVQRNDPAVARMLLAAVDALNRYFCGEPYELPDGVPA
ncbi:beta-lactamase family protein [Nonomuraea sp. K274]|uniref:Beta-lactamase family protein n=1 Tax=Nonomuraea cypriaca TaxID=1187855 RepID=A0A931F238_9ACTN|nr:serine hydrolase domain-containing protein [Nonomuraea cypriaca]MBF8191165.1 beta-lactamase family protein [Nonomuraea cypriaca]